MLVSYDLTIVELCLVKLKFTLREKKIMLNLRDTGCALMS